MKGNGMSKIQTPNGILEDISAEIGYTATTTLIDWLGGTSLYVPQIATEEHFICKMIGMSAFRVLVRCYGNEVINLPIDYRRERTQRNRLIGALLGRGAGIEEIARVSGIGLKQIGHVKSELVSTGMIDVVKDAEGAFLIEPEGIADLKEFEALVIIVGGVVYAKVDAP